MTYYLYRHIRLDTGYPFYIGVGTICHLYGTERSYYYRAHAKMHRSKEWNEIVDSFGYDVEILFETTNEELIRKKETEFIRLYGRIDLDTGILVNRTDGGEGNFSIEHRNLLSKIHKGKTISEETREKIRIANIGRKHTKETVKKMKEFSLKRGIPKWVTEASAKKRRKPVFQLGSNGEIVSAFEFITAAALSLSVDRGDITKCCKNPNKTSGGFRWKYATPEEYSQYLKTKQK